MKMVSLNRRKYAVYIQLTALMSFVSLVIVSTSLATQDWIRATAYPNIEGPLKSDINYGLFKGTLLRRPVYSPYQFDLYITCVWSENSCAWSCANTRNSRETEVQRLVERKNPSFSCIPKSVTTNALNSVGQRSLDSQATKYERVFTNAGLWLSTIILIVILMISVTGSFVLSIINSMKSPAETFLNVQGIYLMNSIALVANFLVLLVYGISYDAFIKKDIAILDTLVGQYKSDATLGYSYWILHVPCVFHAVGIFLIAMRERIVNSDRVETKIDVSNDAPGTGVLY